MKLIKDFFIFCNDWQIVGITVMTFAITITLSNFLPSPPAWLLVFGMSVAIVAVFLYDHYLVGVRRKPRIPIIKKKGEE